MKDFIRLNNRARAVVFDKVPFADMIDENVEFKANEQTPLDALNSLAFKIALQLRINRNLPELQIQRLLTPSERKDHWSGDPVITVGEGWIIDHSYKPYQPDLSKREHYPEGIYLDRDSTLFQFQGERSTEKRLTPNGSLILNSDNPRALTPYTHSEIAGNADETMLKLAVFAVSVNAVII
jgi:hypothetical protein